MTTDQLVEVARLNPQTDIRKVVNFAKSRLSPNRQADLAYAMSLVRGLPEDLDTRMFIYDVLIREPSTPPLRRALRTAIDAPSGFGVIESEKIWLAAAADTRNAAVVFMSKNAPDYVVQKISEMHNVGSAKSSQDMAVRDNLLVKMKEMQGEGFEWDNETSGAIITNEINTFQSVERFVFSNFTSFPDFLSEIILDPLSRNLFGNWKYKTEYKNAIFKAKEHRLKTTDMLLTFIHLISDSDPNDITQLVKRFFDDDDVSFEEKQKAFDKAVSEGDVARSSIRQSFSMLPGENAYNHILKNFLAGDADDMVGILTSNLDKAFFHSEEIYGRMKQKPQLKDEANTMFLAVLETLEGQGGFGEEPSNDNFTWASWFDKARIIHEAGMLENISKETKKSLLIGYLLFIAGLPLWVWAAKSGTSEREMLAHPEVKQKAESIYSSSNDQMRIELDQLKSQIQREVEERQRKALDAPPKQTPPKAAAFKECEVTPELVQTIISLEYDPRKQTSSAGAAGKMQIMKPTWDELNKKHFGGRYPWSKHRFNHKVNIMFGTQYLKDIKAFLDGNKDNWKADQHSLIMACYFGGIGNVENARFDPSIIKRKLPLTYDYMLRGTNLMERDSESLLVFQKKGAIRLNPIAPFAYTRLKLI